MKTLLGKEFKESSPIEVIDYLKSQDVKVYTASPSDMEFKSNLGQLFLQVYDEGLSFEYPMRESCLKKTLKWFSFPTEKYDFLQDGTLLAICNDTLKAINARNLNFKVINSEVVTINSPYYTTFTNLDVIKSVLSLGISKISLNDYIMRIYTEEKYKAEPVVGDTCGFGINIINSETGFSALSVEHFILRYTCVNGATAHIQGVNERKNHYNLPAGELKNFLFERIDKVESSRKNVIFALKKSSDEPAEKYGDNFFYKVDAITGKQQSKDFFKGFDWKKSKYDLFNLITDKAKAYDVTKRYRLERLAGELIMN
ncbi:MAG: hypothetical protein COW85_12380 [Ignavibacteria bacterium CG22_combo_CG10-13_8_21_14_all_37_15]|nr:MAG: hypothetical protein COW85_12380 [Ignavibacteria bacterium CG22_combo_CG10-13_8_21_14_all_37_15]